MRARLDAATRRRDAQQRKLDQIRQQSAELDAELKRTRAHAATLESESLAASARVDSLRERMNAVTSNKEYSALLVEVNTLKTEQGRCEEEALEVLTRVDELAAQAAAFAEQIARQQKLVEAAEAEVRDARAEVGDQLDAATAERDAAAATVPTEVLALFDKLCNEYDGEAVATIEEQNRRRNEFICGGCFIHLPVEAINTLMGKPDDVTICPNCRRILLIDGELKTSLSPK